MKSILSFDVCQLTSDGYASYSENLLTFRSNTSKSVYLTGEPLAYSRVVLTSDELSKEILKRMSV